MMKAARTTLLGAAVLAAAVLTGCATAPQPAPKALAVRINENPYPSTYERYPGVPTLIRNATIFDGEGGKIDRGSILFSDGRVQAVGGPDLAAPEGANVIDAGGRYVTPGIIDVHSHLGDYPSPAVESLSDGNEATGAARPEVWAEHSVWPQDPGFNRARANGGITALQILPGSANLFGGRSAILKNVPARTVQGMKFPGAPYGLKMACGENPKRVYGNKGGPQTRMGNIAVTRATWIKAQEYKRKWDKYEKSGGEMPARDLAMETLRGVLQGKILVHNHCYRADEMALMIDMSKEFGYKIASFQHAVEAYKIADLLRENGICAAMWADWYGFKMESYDAINENIAFVHNAGACAIVHSDDPNGIQRLNQEAAKALAAGRRAGIQISEEVAWTWLSMNPAKSLGIFAQTGSLKAGKMADVVLWNGNPFSVYTRPEKVWVDGALLFDADNPAKQPVSDFELGQPGEGDVK
ncbi:amidohydrolase [Sphingomonas jaspsi]|uniref:amidohydrolase n=1 Tax=Sphingomonas jaspsi TaxID=392409 RepID=UPI0004AF91D7|nr:amidohydrolase [Sphingomonas jaspsi]